MAEPECIERYKILERIGAGGLADVFSAIDTVNGEQVALKVLRDPGRDGTHVRRFLREGRLLQNFTHPRLPRCHRVLESPRPTLVLERLLGCSLSQQIRRGGRVGPALAEAVAAAVLEALAFLHGNGIIHRDVKAGNIYLVGDGRILLMDLGLAVDPADVLTTTLGDVIGTYAYMAPEQIAGAEVDHRCDLYSLGVTLYEAMAGRRPFRAEGAAGYLEAHLGADHVPLEGVASPGTQRRLINLVDRLMARDPAERPSSARVALALLTGQSLHDELRDPPLVGRSGVLGAIEAVLDGGGVVHVVGEPGMGLGRCARLAWARGRARGAEVLTLRCGRIPDEIALFESVARALSPVLGRVSRRRARVISALSDLNAEGPVLLIAEDIDGLAPPCVEALVSLVQGSGVAAVTTSKRVGAAGALEGHLLRLRALTREETGALVCGMLTTQAAPPELVSGLHLFSGGLPAVIVSTVRDLHRRGALRWQGLDASGQQLWQLVRTDWISGGHPLRWAFRSVLSALRADERRLLEVLAVADEELPLTVALQAAGLDEGSTAPFRLAHRGLADEREREPPEDPALGGLLGRSKRPAVSWLGVRRPSIAAMTRLELPEVSGRALHGALALALDMLPAGRWRDERMPYHQALSISGERSAQALVGLGDWLVQQQRYRRALQVLERVPPDRELTPIAATHRAMARGISLLALGRATEARLSLGAAQRLARELSRTDIVGSALVGLGQVQARFGDASRALELAEEALAGSADSVHDPMLPAAMALRADMLRLQGHSGASEESAQNAMDVALIQGRMDVAASAQLGMARLELARGMTEQAGHDLEGAAELLRGSGHGEGLVECYFEISGLHLRRGQVDLALEAAERAEAVAVEIKLFRGRAWGAIARAAVYLSCGDLDGAERILREERFGRGVEADLMLRMSWLETTADLRLLREDRPATLAIHQRALKLAEGAGWFVHRAFHAGMVAILTARGTALSEALSQLYEADDRRRAARLLLEGAQMTADVEILSEARKEIRALGDHFLLLRALHMTGGDEAREEIRALVAELMAGTSGVLREHIEALTAVKWSR